MSPTFGVSSFTVFCTPRSALGMVIGALSELLPPTGSPWSEALFQALFQIVDPAVPRSTVASRVSVALERFAFP